MPCKGYGWSWNVIIICNYEVNNINGEVIADGSRSDLIVWLVCMRLCTHVCCVVYSLDSQIKDSVRQVGSLLAKVSGTGQVSLSQPSQRNIIQQESDTVLQPLMDFLDGSLTMFAQVCEKTILKRLLKVQQQLTV